MYSCDRNKRKAQIIDPRLLWMGSWVFTCWKAWRGCWCQQCYQQRSTKRALRLVFRDSYTSDWVCSEEGGDVLAKSDCVCWWRTGLSAKSLFQTNIVFMWGCYSCSLSFKSQVTTVNKLELHLKTIVVFINKTIGPKRKLNWTV